MEGLLPIIVQLVAGAVGGGGIAAALKQVNMGPVLNMVAGAIGGVGGSQILGMLGMLGGAAATGDAAAGVDMGGLITTAISGLAGGGVLTGIAGMIKNSMAK